MTMLCFYQKTGIILSVEPVRGIGWNMVKRGLEYAACLGANRQIVGNGKNGTA